MLSWGQGVASSSVIVVWMSKCDVGSIPVREKRYQLGHYSAINHHLDLFITTVSQVGQGPYSVHEDIDVGVVDKHREGREDFLDGLYRGRWVFVSAQVHHDPGDIPEEADGDLRVDKS